MSKVLIDSELLEQWVDKLEGSDSAGYGWEDLLSAEMRAILAQPVAEALDTSELKVDVWGVAMKEGFDILCGSAVRVTHIPTGISVERSAERSQFANKEAALAVLTRLVASLYLQGGE